MVWKYDSNKSMQLNSVCNQTASDRIINIKKQPKSNIGNELDNWHWRGYKHEVFVASRTANEYTETTLQQNTNDNHVWEMESWLADKVVDRVGIYGSNAAEGFSAFHFVHIFVVIYTDHKKYSYQIHYIRLQEPWFGLHTLKVIITITIVPALTSKGTMI